MSKFNIGISALAVPACVQQQRLRAQADRLRGQLAVRAYPNSMLTHISVGKQPSRQPMASFPSPQQSSNCASRAKSVD